MTQDADDAGEADGRDWRPTASVDRLKLRARLLAEIRAWFAELGVMEVETPVLSSAATTEVHLLSLATSPCRPHPDIPRRLYLHTSPEFPMKRLLAAGSGPIYQIARVFRDDERGRLHNPEFTLLEWYRPGLGYHQLMDEIEQLLQRLLGIARCERVSYARAFKAAVGYDPHRASVARLRRTAHALGLSLEGTRGRDRGFFLDLIMSHAVAPGLGRETPTFLYDYPSCQASLARIREGKPSVAERFELFMDGVELANGFQELTDPGELSMRMELDLHLRRRLRLPAVPFDARLLAAVSHGLPEGAGVALGLDRLVMRAAGAGAIDEVIAFPIDRA